jgi:hypothetical protein
LWWRRGREGLDGQTRNEISNYFFIQPMWKNCSEPIWKPCACFFVTQPMWRTCNSFGSLLVNCQRCEIMT